MVTHRQRLAQTHPMRVTSRCFAIIFFFYKFIYLFIFFNFWLHWVFVAARGLSLVAASGGYFFFFNLFYFIYLFLAALGLHCCVRAFSSCGARGLLFVAVHRLLIAVASLVAEHGL